MSSSMFYCWCAFPLCVCVWGRGRDYCGLSVISVLTLVVDKEESLCVCVILRRACDAKSILLSVIWHVPGL